MMSSVVYQNVNGLRTKTDEFYLNILNSGADIICITETNLTSEFCSAELFPNNFHVYRRDRMNSSKLSGGGVLIAIKSNIVSRSRDDLSCGVEEVWVELQGAGQHTIFCCVYLPPADDMALVQFTTNVVKVINNKPDAAFLIVGDFNVSDTDWRLNKNNNLVPTISNSLRNRVLRDTLNICSLSQHNHVRNAGGRILDLALTNVPCIFDLGAGQPLVSEDRHHPTLQFSIKLKFLNPLLNNNSYIYNFKNTDYLQLKRCLAGVDWHGELAGAGVGEATDIFYTIISNLLKKFVPRRGLRSGRYPFWYSKATIKVLKEKHKAHKKWKIYNNTIDQLTFKILRGRSKYLIELDYKEYINSIQDCLTTDPSRIWSFVSGRRSNHQIPNQIQFENEEAHEGQAIANLFSTYFSSVYEPCTVSVPGHNELDCLGERLSICRSDIKNKLQNLDVKKGAGPDGLPPCILRECTAYFIDPLFILFNKSLDEGVVPSIWKKSFIVPIFKSGDRISANNYRPISILCTVAKVFDSLIYNKIFRMVKCKIIPQQHGFFPSRSTESNLLQCTQFISGRLDSGTQVDVIYTDYAKAFDKIDHSILLTKLECIGIKGDLLRWLKSYIYNRSQVVRTNGFYSDSVAITSGVPQGSHLAPLLFNIYINDIDKCFTHSHFLEYADDLKIFKAVKTVEDCLALQSDLDRLSLYCQQNKLILNINKCKFMRFTRNKSIVDFNYSIDGVDLVRVESIRDLGVVLDNKLSFDEHIEHIVAKSNKMLGFIMRTCKFFTNSRCITSLYFSFVSSLLNYASVVWAPTYAVHSDRIESVQKKFLRFLCCKTHVEYKSHTAACKHFNILPLKSRRLLNDMIFLFKLVNGEIDCPDVLSQVNFNIPQRQTRNKTLFYLPHCSTNSVYHSPLYRSMMYYNSKFSEFDLFSQNRKSFKKNISSVLYHDIP